MQVHDTPDGGDNARHPNFVLLIENGQIVARVPSATLPTESAGGGRIPLLTLQKEKWYACCLCANWQITNAGFREFYIDGVSYWREQGIATHYDDTTGLYMKLGCYDFFTSLSGQRTAYYRNVEIWSDNDGFATVLGTPPKPPARRISAF